MAEESMFLSDEEVKILTGIRKGKDGKTREQLQCEHLRKYGIPFFPNKAGQPKIARCFFSGATSTPAPTKKTEWRPRVLSAGA
jgi:hypothetical protein